MTTIALPFLTESPGPSDGACGAEPAPQKETTVGNYFVANYPPFAFWNASQNGRLCEALDAPPRAGVDLGVYAHIPFCRKRCHFCYFRVYTDKNSGEIAAYLRAMIDELEGYAERAVVGGRRPRFVYFGGGTPSYLSAAQFDTLSAAMKRLLTWEDAEEITLEAEPGTLNDGKLRAIRAMGVTRLSLGIEHFDDRVLEVNGRAHRSRQTLAAYGWARAAGFPEINVDLIAGMMDETDEQWTDTVRQTIALEPDTVTIYQMEVPFNTTIYKRMKAEGTLRAPVADWATKRRWVDEAFSMFAGAGYTVTSATTAVKDPARNRFVYRGGLFNGSDILSVGVSAFGHVSGVNYQNERDFGPYIDAVRERGTPTWRSYALSDEERYIRELALQLKTGRVAVAPFTAKFGRDPREQFAGALADLRSRGLLDDSDGRTIALSREGLLRADRLLFAFFRPEHRVEKFS